MDEKLERAEEDPKHRWRTIAGVVAAIAITATLDASGLSAFSALPLFPLMTILWIVDRFSQSSMGFVWARGQYFALAELYPAVVLGMVALIARMAGAVDFSQPTGEEPALISCSSWSRPRRQPSRAGQRRTTPRSVIAA